MAPPQEGAPGPEPKAEGSSRQTATTEDQRFFHREAEALAKGQPERAALMFVEAAATAERAGLESDAIVADIEAALALQPASSWLLPLARRTLFRQRRFDRALEICQREVELGGGNANRVAVFREAAGVLRHRLDEPEAALSLLERALAVKPVDVGSLVATAALRIEVERWEPAAVTLEQLSPLLTNPRERALFSYSAGTLRETYLDQPDRAETDYRRAVEQDRRNLAAALALRTLHERRSRWSALCGSLEHLAELAPSPEHQARLLHQAGSLHLDFTGDLEAALRDLRQAVEAAPKEPAYVQRLAYAYEAKGHTRDLVTTLGRLLDLTLDAQGRAALLTHVGWLLQTRLGALEEAVEAYREALDVVEGHLPALQSLGTLYRQQGDFESLLEIYAPEVEGTLPAAVRAVRCMEMGEILTDRLDRPEHAVQYYRRALDLDPDLHPAFWSLRGLLDQLGRHAALAELLATQIERSRDERTRNHLKLELAQLQAGPLGQIDRATDTLNGVHNPDRTRTVGIKLVDFYERSGRHADLAAFLLTQADDTEDPAEARGWRLQAASALELALEEHGRALEIHQRVLGDDPRCVGAIRGAGRIYHRLERWTELVQLHEHELRSGPERPDAPVLLFRIGRILEENLGETAQAIEAYSRALEKDPAYVPALSALEALVRAQRRWPDLVQVLRKYAAARTDRAASADALCRAAEVCDTHLGDLDQAAGLYQEALAVNPKSAPGQHGLLRVYRRLGDWDAAALLLQDLVAGCNTDAERGQFELELARLKEYRLREPPDLELYRAAADDSPHGDCLREELTRILRITRSGELARWLEELGGETSDPSLAAALLLESVHLNQFADDTSGNLGLDAARRAHARQPDDLAVIWSLERALAASTAWSELATLREKEAQIELDPALRVVRLSSAAVAYLQAGEGATAERVAHRCLNFDAHSLTALRVLAQVAEERNDWATLASLCDRIAEACNHPENRLASCLRAAQLWADRVNDDVRALASLWVALTDQPDHAEAFDRAERIYRARGQAEELSGLYRWRIKACRDPAQKAALLREHAHLLRDDLGDVNQAMAELGALLAVDPDDVDALSELSELLINQERWSDAVAKLGTLIDRATDPDVRRRARLQRARLWLHHIHEPRRAQSVLANQLAEDTADPEARRLLVELYTAEGDWEKARRLLELLAHDEDPRVRVWAMIRLAEVARLGLRDEALSQQHELEALELVARVPNTLTELPERYWKPRHPQALVEKVERVLADHPDAAGATQLRAIAARLSLEELGRPARAIEHLRRCPVTEPGQEDLRLLLGQALEHRDELEAATREYRGVLETALDCVEAYRGLARVTAQSGQVETAVAAAALVALLGTPNPKETALLKTVEGVTPPPGRLDLAEMPVSKDLRVVSDVFKRAVPYLDAMYPTYLRNVLDADHLVAAACRDLARALGMGEISVSVDDAVMAEAGLGDPIPLRVASELAGTPGDPRFRFWVGRAIARAASHAVLLDQLDDTELALLLSALTNARSRADDVQQLRKQLGKILPRKVRRQLDAIKLTPTPDLMASYRDAEQTRADQVALLLSRQPGLAIQQLARIEGVPDTDPTCSKRLARLMSYALSQEYARQSRALWH